MIQGSFNNTFVTQLMSFYVICTKKNKNSIMWLTWQRQTSTFWENNNGGKYKLTYDLLCT